MMIKPTRSALTMLLAFLLGIFGCGDGEEGEPLTCDVVQSDDFCWPASVAEATACFDGADERGQLDAERMTCTYASGQVVQFDEPLVEDIQGEQHWRFTVERDGDSCATYSESDTSQSLETSSGLFEVSTNGVQLSISCPDGTRYHTDNPLKLLECEGGIGSLPGTVKSSSGSVVGFGFTGADMGNLWRCESAP